jgi:hypothetical protein
MSRLAWTLVAVALVAPQAAARGAEGTAAATCRALGVMAASGHLSRGRGVPVESAQAIMDMLAREAGVGQDRRARVRAATALGYRASSADAAEREAIRMCEEGRL